MPPSKIHYVKDFNGHIYEVAEESLDAAMASDDRNEYLADYQPNNAVASTTINPTQLTDNSQQVPPVQPQQSNATSQVNVFMRDKDGGIFEIPQANVEAAQKAGGIIVDREGNTQSSHGKDSWGKLAARSAKTISSEIGGGIIDTVSSIYNIPASIQNATRASIEKFDPNYMGENDFVPVSQQQDLPLIPSAAKGIDSSIDKATNDYTKTQEGDSLQSALRLGTAVATPGGLAKTAAKYGHKGVSKVLSALGTTEKKGVASAAAAGAITEEANKAGYGVPTSIALGLAGGAGTGALAGAASLASKKLDSKLLLAKLTGNSPKNINLEAIDAARASGLDIPNAVASKSKGLALAEQVISRTPYFGTKYAKKLNKIDMDYAEKVQQSIRKVGEKIVDSDSPLDMGIVIKDVLTDVKSSIIKEKDELYQLSNSLLPSEATIVPSNTIDAISKIRGGTKTLVPSPDESAVLSYLDKIEKGVVMGAGSDKMALPVPIEMLAGSKVSLNDIINWDINATGAKNQLRKIQHAIKEDLKEYGKTNPEWYKSFSNADEFYGKYLGDKGLGNDAIKKLISQENPEKILPMLNNISDFKSLETALGRDQAGKKFFDSIRSEKLADMILGKVINPNNGTVSYLGFTKSLENRQNKELIRHLAGDNYKELSQLNAYAKAANQHKLRNPNPSGTAPTKLIFSMLAGGAGGGLKAGITGALGGIATPLAISGVAGSALSWLVGNKRALNWGIEAAKKQASGDFKSAEIMNKRIMRHMSQDLGEDVAKQFAALSKEYSKPSEQSK